MLHQSRAFRFNRRFATEIWRGQNQSDNLPKVMKRDGTIGDIDKARGFLDYHRKSEPYRCSTLGVNLDYL